MQESNDYNNLSDEIRLELFVLIYLNSTNLKEMLDRRTICSSINSYLFIMRPELIVSFVSRKTTNKDKLRIKLNIFLLCCSKWENFFSQERLLSILKLLDNNYHGRIYQSLKYLNFFLSQYKIRVPSYKKHNFFVCLYDSLITPLRKSKKDYVYKRQSPFIINLIHLFMKKEIEFSVRLLKQRTNNLSGKISLRLIHILGKTMEIGDNEFICSISYVFNQLNTKEAEDSLRNNRRNGNISMLNIIIKLIIRVQRMDKLYIISSLLFEENRINQIDKEDIINLLKVEKFNLLNSIEFGNVPERKIPYVISFAEEIDKLIKTMK